MGMASGCGEQEAGVASGSGWNLWVWLVGMVVRRTGDKRLETGKRPSNRMRGITNIKRVYNNYWCIFFSLGKNGCSFI